ncbi:MFS transporter [Pseudomonas plecoglossicida]|uniref:MFS transporter n=1 Tax=Pseudomonas plecoglossicida TaxID=70775 RepID=UPI003D1C3341
MKMAIEQSVRYQATLAQRLAGLLLPCFAYFTIMGIPMIFNAIIVKFNVDSATATIATTAEIGCISLLTLSVSAILAKLRPRTTMIVAVSLFLAGEVISILTDSFAVVVAARALAGVGKGLCIGLGLASLAQMQGGIKFLSWVGGVTALITWLGFLVVPALEGTLGMTTIFQFNTILAVIALPLAFILPGTKIEKLAEKTFSQGFKVDASNVAVFILCLLASVACSSGWIYLQQVGEANGLSAPAVGLCASVATLVSAIAPFIATAIFAKNKSVWPMFIATTILGVCMLEYVNTTVTGWWITVIVMSTIYLFLMAYARMYSAYIDSTGRSTAAVGSADSLGLLIGPIVIAAFTDLSQGFGQLGILGASLQFACVLPILLLILRQRRGVASKKIIETH